jgi:hypothetical protein
LNIAAARFCQDPGRKEPSPTSHHYVDNAGILPERTTDPEEAFLLWSIHGASIMVTDRTDAQALVEGSGLSSGPT